MNKRIIDISKESKVFQNLANLSKEASLNAYMPYSNFPVGAAILTASGKIYSGCNVENASYGLTNCAERTAIFSAIADGEKEITMVVVYTPTPNPSSPCGACRQVISEFGKNSKIISTCDSNTILEFTADELLPGAFSKDSM